MYDRYALAPGARIAGPAIVEEREATTVIPPGDSVSVDATGTLAVDIGLAAAPAARVTAETPIEQAAALIEADPVSLEIMWSRLVTVVEEMWHTICRTAFSLIVSEAQDFACDLLDARGDSLAHSPRAMPVFNLTLPRAVKALLEKFPPETLKPGDVLVTNDPWLCAGHLFDIAVVTPVFRDGTLVALTGTVGHVGDIGGTKDSLRAREIYEEGIQIPPMMLYRAGVPNDDLFTLIARERAQERGGAGRHPLLHRRQCTRRRTAAGVHGRVRHARSARARPRGADARRDTRCARRSARCRMACIIRRSGTTRSVEKLHYPLKLTVQGDAIELDFEGAPAQLPQGGLNCTYSYTAAHATYPMKCMLSPQVRSNAGCYRPFTVKAPVGSILNCTKPASVNLRTRVGWYIAPNIFRALADAAPAQVQAATGLPVAINVYGREANGHVYADHFFMGAGQGASRHGDGKSALLYPTSAANTSVELMEARAPVLVLEKSFVTDSGGAGEHRGGCGVRTRLRKLHDDGLPMLASVYPEGVGVTVRGPARRPCGRWRARRGARSERQRGARLRHRRAGHADAHRPDRRGAACGRRRLRRSAQPAGRAGGTGRGRRDRVAWRRRSVTTDFHWLRGRRRSEGSVRHRRHCERSEAIPM